MFIDGKAHCLLTPTIMTQLDYLQNPDLFKSEAKFQELKTTEKGPALVLDRTIFYPQGGGQPADQGQILSPSGVFVVENVRMDENGVVLHFGQFMRGQFPKNETVQLEIDQARRELNTRAHSAGHLIDQALIEFTPPHFKPLRSYHFPDGPYIEYEGTVENPEKLIPQLEKAANSLIAQKIPMETHELSPVEAQMQGFHAPNGKSVRIINFKGGLKRGCGGTQVQHSGEIGPIHIRKISCKKGKTKVAYTVE